MSTPQHVVVDGSNIATEGRSMPSLHQLDEAVRAFAAEYPDAEITVVVDATFGHRIPASERSLFDEGVANGELVSPPAGAIGRGDAFVLRIADKVNATVLSNDSFQEFHGEHEWLFTPGRLIGGKPVPAVGWIFTLRTPVRGIKSRESMKEARRKGSRTAKKVVADAIQVATREAQKPKIGDTRDPEREGGRRRRRGSAGPPSDPVNEPLPFITFIAEHMLGSEVEGEVESFSSHGAFVLLGDAKGYIPLSAMGDPPPRAARDVLNKGEKRTFVVQALDPLRRGIELALPGYAKVAGAPTDETVEAEIQAGGQSKAERKAAAKAAAEAAAEERARADRGARGEVAPEPETVVEPEPVPEPAAAEEPVPAKKTVKKATKKTAAKKAAPSEVEPVKKAAAPKKAATNKAAATKEAAPKKAVAKKVAAKKAAAPVDKEATKKAAAKKVAKKAAASAPKKAAASAPKKAAAKKAAPAKKAVAPKKAAAKKA